MQHAADAQGYTIAPWTHAPQSGSFRPGACVVSADAIMLLASAVVGIGFGVAGGHFVLWRDRRRRAGMKRLQVVPLRVVRANRRLAQEAGRPVQHRGLQ